MIAKAFAKAGVYPVNYDVIFEHVVAPSLVTGDVSDKENQPETDPENQQPGCSKDQEVLKIPHPQKNKTSRKSPTKKSE